MKKFSSLLRGYISRFTDAIYFFPTIAMALLGMVWMTTINLIQAEFTTAHQTARTVGRELLQTYEAQVLRSLKEIDQSLKIIRYAHESNRNADTLEILETHDLLPPLVVFSVCIVDADGNTISSTDSGFLCRPSRNFLDKLKQTDALVISNPRESTGTALSFGRRLNDASGTAAGAVIIMIEPEYFVSGYETQDFGSKGLNGLLGEDGVFRALRIGEDTSAGSRAIANPAILDANGSIETYWDGAKRYTFSQQLFGYPLAAIVGLAEDEQLAGARENAWTYSMRATAGSIFLMLVFAALFRESRLLSLSRKREQEQAAQVQYMAYHDVLTGLANRGLFSKLLQQELALARRHKRSFSLLFLDLDRFKYINDTLGHAAGDRLLIEVGKRLTSSLRDSDVVARIGGDEFVVLLHCHKDENCAKSVAQKIIHAVAEPYHILGNELRITVSIGISMFPQHGEDEHTLMKNADTAMYHAKMHGKNDFQLYSSDLQPEKTA